jgi:hypothetical protein
MSKARDRHWRRRTAGHEGSKAGARRRKIKFVVLPTTQAIKALKQNPDETNPILRITC